jgi:hypothetical protein
LLIAAIFCLLGGWACDCFCHRRICGLIVLLAGKD